MSATKLLTIIGLTGKVEASYGAGGSLSVATDGIQLAELPEVTPQYGHDGTRAMPPGTAGTQRRVVPSGRFAEPTFKLEPKGAGAAYSASVVPPGIHTLMRISGHDAALDATAGFERWTYTPTAGPAGFASGVFDAYVRGEKYPLTAALGDYSEGVDGPGVPLAEFPVSALLGAPTETAAPAITYSNTVQPPKATGLALTLGSFLTAKARSYRFAKGQERSPRLDINAAGGHAGWSMGRRAPTLEVSIEATALVGSPYHTAAGLDPYFLRDLATPVALSLVIGSVQYNRRTISAPQAQLVDVGHEADGPTALWKLSFAISTSTPAANDDYSVVYN